MTVHKIKLSNTFDWQKIGNSISTFIKFDGGVFSVEWKNNTKEIKAQKDDYFMINCDGGFPVITKMTIPVNPVARAMWENGATKAKRVETLEELKDMRKQFMHYHAGWGYEKSYSYLRLNQDESFAVLMVRRRNSYTYKPHGWWAKDINSIGLATAAHMTKPLQVHGDVLNIRDQYYNPKKAYFYAMKYTDEKRLFEDLALNAGLGNLSYEAGIKFIDSYKKGILGEWVENAEVEELDYPSDHHSKLNKYPLYVNLGTTFIRLFRSVVDSEYTSLANGNKFSHYACRCVVHHGKNHIPTNIFSDDYDIKAEEVERVMELEEDHSIFQKTNEMPPRNEYELDTIANWGTLEQVNYVQAKMMTEIPKLEPFKTLVDEAKFKGKFLVENLKFDISQDGKIIMGKDILNKYEAGFDYTHKA